MIAYTMLGSNDLPKAGEFYDALFALLDGKRVRDSEQFIAYANGRDQLYFCVCKPYDGNAATVGNGVMISLVAKNREHVDQLHAKALELGGADEGAPGVRAGGFYAAYFRDLDGNKINFICMD
ncbi:VOC family protein [Acanthopleuribacter pedis]|uniref:VOC family protein n=1 Tax=Acanthopleuribacter pedis TaxID=442870 RepID=A0A8J7QAI3_9BACT|nr:VOC family protein [Acanthopleuribacter pedis]MBO1320670.1 VOC family protein [Acanthopleuribacter pedis]